MFLIVISFKQGFMTNFTVWEKYSCRKEAKTDKLTRCDF